MPTLTYLFRNLNEVADALDRDSKRMAETKRRTKIEQEFQKGASYAYAVAADMLRSTLLTGQPTHEPLDFSKADQSISGGPK